MSLEAELRQLREGWTPAKLGCSVLRSPRRLVVAARRGGQKAVPAEEVHLPVAVASLGRERAEAGREAAAGAGTGGAATGGSGASVGTGGAATGGSAGGRGTGGAAPGTGGRGTGGAAPGTGGRVAGTGRHHGYRRKRWRAGFWRHRRGGRLRSKPRLQAHGAAEHRRHPPGLRRPHQSIPHAVCLPACPDPRDRWRGVCRSDGRV